MNHTNRQVISDIVSDLRAVNLDDRVSKRYIHNKLRDFAALFIKRDAELRKIFNISDIWTDVPCVEFCEAPMAECCDIDLPDCKFVMKSHKKLPDTFETFYRELIQIFNPIYAKEFKQTTPQQYKNIISREYKDPRIKYFWLSNGYIIIPDSLVEVATLRLATFNPDEALRMGSCYDRNNECIALLDQRFVCPDYLISVVKQETLKDLFNFYKRNALDESPNLNTNLRVGDNR